MRVAELFELPNLLSLSRIVLAPPIGYLLMLDTNEATWACLGLLVLAGITDWADGWAARKKGSSSELGMALDPIADKIFAGLLIIFIVLYRDMPLWLALVIVGRDLLILIASVLLLGDRKHVAPSNHFGKYAFGAIVVLLGSYVIRFPFGIEMMTWATLAFIAASMISYTIVFFRLKKNQPVPDDNTRAWRYTRYTVSLILFVIYMVQLGRYYLG